VHPLNALTPDKLTAATTLVKGRAGVHPLEPLTPDELTAAAGLVRAHAEVPGAARFASITLREPEKERLGAFVQKHGPRPAREAEAVLVDRTSGRLIHAVADLDAGAAWAETIAGAHPPVLLEEFELAAEAIRRHPAWRAALRKRGIENFDLVQIDPLATGRFGEDFEDDRRVVRGVAYVRRHASDNGYARPIEGVIAYVDLNRLDVFRVDDLGVTRIPEVDGAYAGDSVALRDDIKALDIVQPDGPGFVVDGHEIRWQRWRLRVSIHPMEGLVLHTVGYEDGGRVRSIIHRASIAEMVVPYGETSPMHYWKNYFDAGEYGLGKLVNSLELGCDCLGVIQYFDAHFVDADGEPYTVKNAICVHEEDHGILWKHQDYVTGEVEVRRSRRLVISAIHTVGNYEYGFYWHLYQDGTIQAECKLTGIVATMAVEDGADLPYSEMVDDGLAAPHHQHIFCFRLDLDVDGPDNSVIEVESRAEPMGADNPHGNAFRAQTVRLQRERQAQRVADPSRSRYWKVLNESSRNRVGQPVAYKLIPGHGIATLLADPRSSIARRAGFATKNLWVTPYERDERHAAGTYPYQHAGGAGLPEWTAGDRSLEDRDVVLWYCVGVTHFVRPEDWPVMPVEHAGFTLKPHGFFDRNPALDVPPQPGHCHHHAGGEAG
jgi:primary-amine oxidase